MASSAAATAEQQPAADGAANDSDIAASRARDVKFKDYIGTWKLDERAIDGLHLPDFDAKLFTGGDFKLLVRGRKDGHDINEKKNTQPFVNRALRAALPKLRAGVAHKLAAREENLFFYEEPQKMITDDAAATEAADTTTGVLRKAAELHRRPDGAFFVRHTSAAAQVFDGAAQRASLVTVEAKRALDSGHVRSALVECERDFVEVAGRKPASEMRIGHAIITSGVEWYFVRMWWTVDDHIVWKRVIEVSDKVDVSVAGGEALLAKWLLFSLCSAGDLPTKSTGLNAVVDLINAASKVTSVTLTSVLSVGTRSTVSRWRAVRGGATFVLKSPVAAITQKRADKLKGYAENELNMLRKLADQAVVCFPKLVDNLLSVPPEVAIFVHDGGHALHALDICGLRGKQLAQVVKRDILLRALPVLKQLEVCHCDIWATNIVVKQVDDDKAAMLIDWESAVRVGADTHHSPVHTSKANQAIVGRNEYDEKCTKSVLWFLWSPLFTAFDTSKHDGYVARGIEDAGFAAWLDEE